MLKPQDKKLLTIAMIIELITVIAAVAWFYFMIKCI